MKRFMIGLGLLMFSLLLASLSGEIRQSGKIPEPDYGNAPLYFIPNQGQADSEALFYAKASGYTLWMTKEGLVLMP